MTSIVHRIRPRHLSWPTALVLASVVLVALSLALTITTVVPLMVTTVSALVGGTGFVLGVSASISAFFERDSYADSDFYR